MSTTPHLEPIGVGAYHNPWRLLSPSEKETVLTLSNTIRKTAPIRVVNGVQEQLFSYGGYSFLYQINGGYLFVYNHPGPIVFNQKAYETAPPGVPTRGGIPVYGSQPQYAALRGVPHWLGVGSGTNDDIAIGHPDEGLAAYVALPNPQNRPEISAAIDFLAYYDANGCSKQSLPVVVALQNAYNASGLPGQLTVDGEYGPNTQRATQNIMDEAQADAGAGPSQQAPANCFPEYGNVPSIPALDRPNATPATPSGGTYVAPVTTVTGGAAKSNAAILLIGGAAAATAGGLGWWYYKRHKRGR